ncbi:hypothetical protein [Spirillospora albida]|uniref:hypothetical protein n=1 Tax=Spirillospora albida TaxID=58123 RepID=UPI0006907D1D|nr:hypothetical protein [Spirillospora albida]
MAANSRRPLDGRTRNALTGALRARLGEEFAEWSLWVSDEGTYYATRRHLLSAAELWNGCAQTVHADTGDGLRDRLAEQREQERQALVQDARQAGGPR